MIPIPDTNPLCQYDMKVRHDMEPGRVKVGEVAPFCLAIRATRMLTMLEIKGVFVRYYLNQSKREAAAASRHNHFDFNFWAYPRGKKATFFFDEYPDIGDFLDLERKRKHPKPILEVEIKDFEY